MAVTYEGGVLTKITKGRKGAKVAAVESTPATPEPAPKQKKLKLVKGDSPAPEIAPASAAETPAPTKPKGKKKSFEADLADVAARAQSLAGLADAFTGKLRGDGKTASTINAYRGELRLALAHFGESTRVADLTTESVAAYFTSKPLMKLRSGRSKSQLSIDKSRRVLRQALTWAAAQGWIPTAPLPELPSAI